MDTDPVARRDAGLRRLSSITKGTMAGGLVLTGALSAVAAHSFSGTSSAATQAATASTASTAATTATTTPSTTAATTPATTRATTATTQLQTPVTIPRSSSGSGRVTSGGS
jgi:hypothetical protein